MFLIQKSDALRDLFLGLWPRGADASRRTGMQTAILIVVFGLLSGCATVGSERVTQLPTTTKIVALSLMGDNLEVDHIGLLGNIFTYAYSDIDVSAWKVDEYTEKIAVSMLSEDRKFTALLADTTRVRKHAGSITVHWWFNTRKLKVSSSAVKELAKEAGGDFVLVTHPVTFIDPFFGANIGLFGYGIYQSRPLHFFPRAVNYVTMRIALFDGATGAEVAWTDIYQSKPRSDSAWMKPKNFVLKQSDETSTRASIEEMIKNLLQKGLTDLNLLRGGR